MLLSGLDAEGNKPGGVSVSGEKQRDGKRKTGRQRDDEGTNQKKKQQDRRLGLERKRGRHQQKERKNAD